MPNVIWGHFGATYTMSVDDWKPTRAYRFHLLLTKDDDDTYSAVALNLPGVGSCGSTIEEAIENVKEAALAILESYQEFGTEIPWKDTSGVSVPFGAKHKWAIVNA